MADLRPVHHSIQVPTWALFVTLAALVLSIASSAILSAMQVGRFMEAQETINGRLCRIEAAVHIPPWPTCEARKP